MKPTERKAISTLRGMANQAFSRAAGAPLIPGNQVRLLRNAEENYPAWLDAIAGAQRFIHFESYIIHEDEIGRRFAEALIERARAGVAVRLIYDWMGGLGKTSRRFWRHLLQSGVDVRCFNPPRLDSPFGWLSRDHRKMIGVDGRVAFVTGLCVGHMWVGDPRRNIEPWRDTGIEVRGPGVGEIEQAFATIWASMGEPLPESEIINPTDIEPAGDTMLRVIASQPNTAGLYRLDQMIAALATRTLWLSDAYYAGMTPYVQALRAAAMDGVDVRLLVPSGTDIPVLRALSQAGYRPLLEAGVRVFEWNGPMMHAKTAVADGRWARVGSTNLNLASWLGNWELDIAVEDEAFAEEMEEMYLDDLENSTEIVLSKRKRVRPLLNPPRRRRRRGGGSAGRAVAGAVRLGNTVGAAITDQRVLGPAEARILATAAFLLLIIAVLMILWPRAVMIPLAALAFWVAISFLLRAYNLHQAARRGEAADQELE